MTVTQGQTTGVSISCVPASPTALTHFTQVAGSVEANSMEYYSFEVGSTERHKVWVMDPSVRGLVVLFDPSGRMIEQEEFWPADWRDLTFYPD